MEFDYKATVIPYWKVSIILVLFDFSGKEDEKVVCHHELPIGIGDLLHLSVVTSLMVNLGNSKSEPKITGLTFFHCNKSSSVVLETEIKISEMTYPAWLLI